MVVGSAEGEESGLDGDSIEFGSLPDTLEFVSRMETNLVKEDIDSEESSFQSSSDSNRSEALL